MYKSKIEGGLGVLIVNQTTLMQLSWDFWYNHNI